MNDLETRLRNDLKSVAETTRADSRLDQIGGRRSFRSPIWVAVVSFVVVIAVGIPVLLLGPGGGDVAAEVPTTTQPLTSTVISPSFVLDPSWFTVEESDLRWFDNTGSPEGRQSLRTESVWCLHKGSFGSATRASSFPVGEELTAEHLEYECSYDNDSARSLDAPPQTVTFCTALHTQGYFDEAEASGEITLDDGPLNTRPGFMVVLGWEADCPTERLATTPNVPTLSRDISLEKVNQARRMEIAVTAASFENCFTYEQARAVADEARRLLDDGWVLGDWNVDAGVCHQPQFETEFGAILVSGREGGMGLEDEMETSPGSETIPPNETRDSVDS